MRSILAMLSAAVYHLALNLIFLACEGCLMTKNVGGIDRLIRYGLGMTLIAMTLPGFIGAWGWIGLVPLATAIFGSCALYSLLGVRTGKAA